MMSLLMLCPRPLMDCPVLAYFRPQPFVFCLPRPSCVGTHQGKDGWGEQLLIIILYPSSQLIITDYRT